MWDGIWPLHVWKPKPPRNFSLSKPRHQTRTQVKMMEVWSQKCLCFTMRQESHSSLVDPINLRHVTSRCRPCPPSKTGPACWHSTGLTWNFRVPSRPLLSWSWVGSMDGDGVVKEHIWMAPSKIGFQWPMMRFWWWYGATISWILDNGHLGL